MRSVGRSFLGLLIIVALCSSVAVAAKRKPKTKAKPKAVATAVVISIEALTKLDTCEAKLRELERMKLQASLNSINRGRKAGKGKLEIKLQKKLDKASKLCGFKSHDQIMALRERLQRAAKMVRYNERQAELQEALAAAKADYETEHVRITDMFMRKYITSAERDAQMAVIEGRVTSANNAILMLKNEAMGQGKTASGLPDFTVGEIQAVKTYLSGSLAPPSSVPSGVPSSVPSPEVKQ
jgi:hypothetical protein